MKPYKYSQILRKLKAEYRRLERMALTAPPSVTQHISAAMTAISQAIKAYKGESEEQKAQPEPD